MTMVRVSHLKCDECGAAGPFGDGHHSRVQAERDGWQVRVGVRRWQVGNDLCPTCKASKPPTDIPCILADPVTGGPVHVPWPPPSSTTTDERHPHA